MALQAGPAGPAFSLAGTQAPTYLDPFMTSLVHIGAIVYGLSLVATLFIRTPLTEALRIDSLFFPEAGEKTRPANLIVGVLIAGYGAWSLMG